MKTKCTATTKAGEPCQAWAVEGPDPPRCAAHGGGKAPVGAPAGNKNALTHGLYQRPTTPIVSIDDAIEHLADSLNQLADYIREHLPEMSVDEIARLQAVRGQNLSRYARMLRDKALISGGVDDELQRQIDAAFAIVNQKLELEL